MKTLNGHNLKKGDTVKVTGPDLSVTRAITHISSMYIHVGDYMFFKTSGNGANYAASLLKLQKV